MKLKKILLFFQNSITIFKKIKTAFITNNIEKTIYRIIQIKQSDSDNCKIIVQVVGKSAIMECHPCDVANTDSFLTLFSKKDIKKIICLAFSSADNKPKYQIISQETSDKNNLVFKIKQIEKNLILKKAANQILLDKKMLTGLSLHDVASISFMAGYECAEKNNFSVGN